jgi:uncharacterized protein
VTLDEQIIETVLEHLSDVQGIYRFGTSGTENERPDSDVDIAVLLAPMTAKELGSLTMNPCHLALEKQLSKDVDLINVRDVSTVFRKEIIMNGRIIYCADRFAVDEFEMLTISYYMKLNEERAEILKEGLRSGRFYDV